LRFKEINNIFIYNKMTTNSFCKYCENEFKDMKTRFKCIGCHKKERVQNTLKCRENNKEHFIEYMKAYRPARPFRVKKVPYAFTKEYNRLKRSYVSQIEE
jgi:hypothetical protein